MTRRTNCLAFGGALALIAAMTAPARATGPVSPVDIDSDDIGGVVASGAGREAGVWVIAETTDLGTRYAKGVDGRIDDPAAGWKGRGLWSTSGNRTAFHIEAVDAPAPGAPGKTPQSYSSPLMVNFQLRPDPLAH